MKDNFSNNIDKKDKVYLVSPNFIEEKVKKIIEMPEKIGFIASFGSIS